MGSCCPWASETPLGLRDMEDDLNIRQMAELRRETPTAARSLCSMAPSKLFMGFGCLKPRPHLRSKVCLCTSSSPHREELLTWVHSVDAAVALLRGERRPFACSLLCHFLRKHRLKHLAFRQCSADATASRCQQHQIRNCRQALGPSPNTENCRGHFWSFRQTQNLQHQLASAFCVV